MDYITCEQFLEQPKEVQKIFLDYWKPEIGDLFCDIDAWNNKNISCVLDNDKINCIEIDKKHNYYIPLFSEGQLRKFIEDNMKDNIIAIYSFDGYTISNAFDYDNGYITNKYDLLQAYWEVACEIAKEVRNE